MKVLLAVDASPDSRHAARIVTGLAEPPDLDILHVVDLDALKHAYISPSLPAGYYETYRQEVSEAAERVLHDMKAELVPYAKHLRLIADAGDAAESIVQTAEESRADLIVLGQRGMTASFAFLLGGVSQKVATYAPCSVLVVKDSAGSLDRLLLAVDGSEASDRAVRFLETAPFKGPLHITVVTVWAQGGETAPRTAQAKGEDFLATIAQRLARRAVAVETEYLTGDPALAILDAASRRQARMIVLGARGAKAIQRFLLGSVSQKVLVHAPCSVLIVR